MADENDSDEPAEISAPEEFTIAFKKPIIFADCRYEDVTIREPTAGQMEEVEAFNGVRTTMELIRMTGAIPRGAIKQMVISDIRKAADYFVVFTHGARWRPARA